MYLFQTPCVHQGLAFWRPAAQTYHMSFALISSFCNALFVLVAHLVLFLPFLPDVASELRLSCKHTLTASASTAVCEPTVASLSCQLELCGQ